MLVCVVPVAQLKTETPQVVSLSFPAEQRTSGKNNTLIGSIFLCMLMNCSTANKDINNVLLHWFETICA